MNGLLIVCLLTGFTTSPALQRLQSEAPNALLPVWFDGTQRLQASDVYRAELYGARLRMSSEWLNGASFWTPSADIQRLGTLFRASSARPVAVLKTSSDNRTRLPDQFPMYEDRHYGNSYEQISVIDAEPMHKNGYIGNGIVIGVFDTGFDSTHPAISHLWSGNRIVAHYDFASGDHIGYENGQVPVQPLDEVKYINSMDAVSDGDDIIIVYSSATESQLAANPIIRNRWHINMVTGHRMGSVISWSSNPIEIVADSFAIQPDIEYRSGTVYMVYQFKRQFFGFDVGYVRFDTSGVFYFGPAVIDSSPTDEVNPKLLISDSDRVFVSYFSGNNYVVRVGEGANPVFTTYLSVPIGEPNYGGNDGVMTDSGPFFVFSASSRLYAVADSQVIPLEMDGELPDLMLWNDTIHLIFVVDSLIKHAVLSRSGELTDTSTVATDCGLSFPKLTVANGRLAVVYADPRGRIFRKYIDGGDGELLSDGIADIVEGDSGFVLWRMRGDPDVYPENYVPHSGSPRYHGTKVLSVIAGFYPGMLIGVAPGARFILARTEKTLTSDGVNFENQVEEDFWIEALEWAAANGVNIVSSSLGYADWYRKSDMDGSTAPISRAASQALEHNILVVNAIGNVRHTSFPDPAGGDTTLVAPADARGIIAVGAYEVDSSTGELLPPAGALGPTADGRIKPEVIAPYWTFTAADMYLGSDTTFVTRFIYSAGTSFGTALVSGGAALVWEAHPDWTAAQVREAIMDSAKPVTIPGYQDAPIPNNIVGWGLIDVAKAAGVQSSKEDLTEKDQALTPYPSPAISGEPLTLRYNLYRASNVGLFIYKLNGELVWKHEIMERSIGYNEFLWDGRDMNGNPLAPGLYLFVIRSNSSVSTVKFAVK